MQLQNYDLKFKNQIKSLIPYIYLHEFRNEKTLIIDSENLHFAIYVLKKHIGFQYSLLSCISGVDYNTQNARFCVVYDLLSPNFNTRLRVKTFANEISPIDSICDIHTCANWWEREVWDMFGIYFTNHPDLRRILTDYGFEGHPLRKDFPLSGFVEVRYDQGKQRIILEPVEFAQEYRYFNIQNVWSNLK